MINNMLGSLSNSRTSHDHPLELIEAAEEMIIGSRFEVAVVTAQMACEISVERVLKAYFSARGLNELEAPIQDLLPSFNLGNDKIRKFYIALTGDNISREFFWSEYKTMVKIRNTAIHSGSRIQKSQAQMALRIAKSVIQHLKRVEQLASQQQ